MKNIITILLFFVCLELSAQHTTRYVATNGNDSNPGTIAQPFLTWQKGISVTDAGDTLYIRGGVYYEVGTTTSIYIYPNNPYPWPIGNGHTGTAANHISIFGYPPDVAAGNQPILDGRDQYGANTTVAAFSIASSQFIHLKDFTIRNYLQSHTNGAGNALAVGLNIGDCANLTFERITVHDIGGRGVSGGTLHGYYSPLVTPAIVPYDTTKFINCDFYNIIDSLSTNPGNAGDGIKFTVEGAFLGAGIRDSANIYPHSYLLIEGCRFWNFSDDGSDIGGPGVVEHRNNWSMPSNKYKKWGIEGSGFKISAALAYQPAYTPAYPDTVENVQWRIVKNNIALFAPGNGFFNLCYPPYYSHNARYYNNIAFKCGIGFTGSISETRAGENSIWRNNISYQSTTNHSGAPEPYSVAIVVGRPYTESHNSWDRSMAGYPWFVETDSVTITDADFIGLDGNNVADSLYLVSLFTAPRNSNGSLPTNNLLRLVGNSDLIGAGKNVGMSATPNMGIDWAYYDATYGAGVPTPPATFTPTIYTNAVTKTAITAVIGGNVTATGGAAITARGICWATTENPTTANSTFPNLGQTGTFSGTIRNLASGTTYYVRSYATNSVGTAYGSQVSFTTPVQSVATDGSGTIYLYEGKPAILK